MKAGKDTHSRIKKVGTKKIVHNLKKNISVKAFNTAIDFRVRLRFPRAACGVSHMQFSPQGSSSYTSINRWNKLKTQRGLWHTTNKTTIVPASF
jgi:hypothetical protein